MKREDETGMLKNEGIVRRKKSRGGDMTEVSTRGEDGREGDEVRRRRDEGRDEERRRERDERSEAKPSGAFHQIFTASNSISARPAGESRWTKQVSSLTHTPKRAHTHTHSLSLFLSRQPEGCWLFPPDNADTSQWEPASLWQLGQLDLHIHEY